jgi:TonB-linked SusC/RagA family outer membrane protein
MTIKSKQKSVHWELNRLRLISKLSLLVLTAPALTYANPGGETKVPAKYRQLKDGTITGVVTDEGQKPLAGVTITVAGSKKSVVTGEGGHFKIDGVKEGDVIEISSVGFKSTTLKVASGQTQYSITLSRAVSTLNDVVVTALGVKRSAKSLTYSTDIVAGESVNRVKTDNLMNALTGKVAGLTISQNSSGLGGSVKVTLRGSKSASGSNQPLYVIDGVPMLNTANANGYVNTLGTNGVVADGGDGISNLNPDDIESMTVLKGASAAALYGSQAENGVIIITTKKGKAGKAQINFSSSFMVSKVYDLPKFQTTYGQTSAGSPQSWGSKIDTAYNSDYTGMFFQTGHNLTNAINMSWGSENVQTYFSYANTSANGVIPQNTLGRNNVTLREVAKFLKNKLTLDGSASYISQKTNNALISNGSYNPLASVYQVPRGLNLGYYKDNYQVPSAARNGLLVQNWALPVGNTAFQNPWWMLNKMTNVSQRNRFLVTVSANYEASKWLNLQARANIDRTADNYQNNLWAGTFTTISAASGQFVANTSTVQQSYADFIANAKLFTKGKFKLNALAGASITDGRQQGYTIGSNQPGLGLFIPNVFTVQNMIVTNANNAVAVSSNVSSLPENHSQTQSIFASADASYADWLFLTVTGRNDWSSNLSYTPNGSYFYPSVGLSAVLNQALNLPHFVSYAKVRGSFAEVGNAVPLYVTHPLNNLGANGGVTFPSVAPFPQLKPEMAKSIEVGTDWKFFNNRLAFDFTWYKNNTTHQFFQITTSPTNGYGSGYVNAGNIQNSGVEMTLSGDVVRHSKFVWNTSINYARNKNKVLDVASDMGVNQFLITAPTGIAFETAVTKGGQYGDMYGQKIATDAQGRTMLGPTGLPILVSGYYYMGNINPTWQGGWSNSFTYKNFALNVLVDGRFGGQVYSQLQASLDNNGVSKASGDARDAGGLKINGVDTGGKSVSIIDPFKWYSIASQTNQYIYSATAVRLREVTLGYTVPLKSSVISALRISLIGRNLLFFYKKAPQDPETVATSGNGLSGWQTFNMPSQRNYGISANITF